MNLNPIWEGIAGGISLALLIGPAFFTLIQTSIYRGLKAGIILSTGIFFSDITLVLLSYFGLSQILGNGNNNIWIGIIGGIILIIFGIVTYYRKPHQNEQVCDEGLAVKQKNPSNLTYFLKGYVLNIANPFLLIFWMSIVILIKTNYHNDKSDIFLFFSTMLMVVLITDIIKSFVANRIKSYLKPPLMLWLNRCIGILLSIFGIILIFKVFYTF